MGQHNSISFIKSLLFSTSVTLIITYYPRQCFAFPVQKFTRSHFQSKIKSGFFHVKFGLSQNENNNNKSCDIDKIPANRIITVSKAIDVPFSSEIAFEKFSNITRQAEFSPWLRKVEYVNPSIEDSDNNIQVGETKWYMGFRGFSITWNSICTTLDYPNCIEWESTSGMKNYGKVVFVKRSEELAKIKLTMTFVAPRIASIVLRRTSAINNFVGNRMLRPTLENFRDIVAEEICTIR